MMIDGEWQVSSDEFSEEQFLLNYGVAPFPPSMEHPESAKTTVVQGPVVIIPKGTIDKAAAVRLLAWMISPENLAEAADVHFMLPVTRMATQDARFQKNPAFKLFIELMDSTNTRIIITSR